MRKFVCVPSGAASGTSRHFQGAAKFIRLQVHNWPAGGVAGAGLPTWRLAEGRAAKRKGRPRLNWGRLCAV